LPALLLIAFLLASIALPVAASPATTPAASQVSGLDAWQRADEEAEIAYQPDYLYLATGDPWAEHAVYAWPFALESIGHVMQSYQYYGGDPYFHHGMDIMAPSGTQVYNRPGGQVVNIENYTPGNDLYWEIAILDPQGYLWQYHHIDHYTIPQYVWNKYNEYLIDPVNGGFVPADTYIGNIVFWPVGYPGAPSNFHHIHLNILGANGYYLQGMEFHNPLSDTALPQIQGTGLLKNGQIYPGNQVSGEYSLYVHARDLVLAPDWYWLPPYQVTFSVDGGPTTTVWKFDTLPGGGDRYAYVSDYYVVPPTCGDYDCNEFYIDLGFLPGSQRQFPATSGAHSAVITVKDFAGNTAAGTFNWTVTGGLQALHVGDIDGKAKLNQVGNWKAAVAVVVHNASHAPLANATVSGTWSSGTPVSGSCVTNSRGKCVIATRLSKTIPSVVFTVDSVTLAGYGYTPASNHDPDGDSNGTTITINKP
jgi:hypothetical protein